MNSIFRATLSACAIAGIAAVAPVHAATQTFTASDGSAQAIFTTGAGTVDITLTNLVTNTVNVTNLLSDISFSVSGGGTITGTQTVTPTAPNGTLVCADGTAGCVAGGAGHDWFYGMNQAGFDNAPVGTGSYLLTALIGNHKSLIIGDHSFSCNPKCPDGLGQQGFQPYYNGTAEFLLAIAGVTADSVISAVTFSFGTAPERLVGVPIPAAVWLFGSGLLGLIGIGRRRMSVANSLAAT